MPRPEDSQAIPGQPTSPGVPVTQHASQPSEPADTQASVIEPDTTTTQAALPKPNTPATDESPTETARDTANGPTGESSEQADKSTPKDPADQTENDKSTADKGTEDQATKDTPAHPDNQPDNQPDTAQTPPPVAVMPRPKPIQPAQQADKQPAKEPVVQTPTGLLLDGRWEVDGKGTKASPYTIDWDMLVALQRDYQPRLGQTEIPEWINAINGKTVTIRGYALLPMGMSSLSELLVMLNQWDSCCIGVPPTPFDAIEVRLAENLTNTAQSMFSHTGALSFGDITGTFKIDPYIVQGYLLGLYLMEDATANLVGPAGTP